MAIKKEYDTQRIQNKWRLLSTAGITKTPRQGQEQNDREGSCEYK